MQAFDGSGIFTAAATDNGEAVVAKRDTPIETRISVQWQRWMMAFEGGSNGARRQRATVDGGQSAAGRYHRRHPSSSVLSRPSLTMFLSAMVHHRHLTVFVVTLCCHRAAVQLPIPTLMTTTTTRTTMTMTTMMTRTTMTRTRTRTRTRTKTTRTTQIDPPPLPRQGSPNNNLGVLVMENGATGDDYKEKAV